ncbi:MAG: phenylacetate--CoA ligase [Deltaproteobacteria bacterium]|jgi:phenylacetate-coenzyme A ligase PaaK-like adenylate-forming protein|nr:phenylacetate--CoA ligase [Deltaproteobacteria bacterium]
MKITPLEEWISRTIGNRDAKLTREKIEHYQLSKLRETIRLARTQSPFYRERLAGLTEDRISRIRDLAHFPFTTAEDLRSEPLSFLCVSQGEISRVVTLHTSGTTGNPKRIYFTGEDQERTIDFFHHGMSTLVSPGDSVLILLPGERPGSVGDLLQLALARLGVRGIPHGPVSDVFSTLNVIAGERITALVGIPTQVFALARCSDGGWTPRAVLLSTDHIPHAISREIHRIWGSEVFGHYGMTEMGFGGGVECEARYGYHMREADLLFEIVHPDTGKPLPDGEAGEVIFTTLTRHGMPLIRYRTGDLSRFKLEPCPCGTVLKTMERVRERISGAVRIADEGSFSMADLDEVLFSIPNVLGFTVTLSRENASDHLHIALKLKHIHDPPDAIQALAGKALDTIPAIKSAQEKGRLDVLITSSHSCDVHMTNAAKRTIFDRRKTEKTH